MGWATTSATGAGIAAVDLLPARIGAPAEGVARLRRLIGRRPAEPLCRGIVAVRHAFTVRGVVLPLGSTSTTA